MPRYAAFDIEIARTFPDGAADWKAFRPLGITCAALLTQEGELTLWKGETPAGLPAPQMSRAETCAMAATLLNRMQEGWTLLTWNGLGFDFDILAEESGMKVECSHMAMNHVDMMFHIFCQKGHPLGLDKAAKGMGLPGKMEGMDGSLAPRLWAEGQFQKVLDYVAQDVRATLDLALTAEKKGCLNWISSKGKPQTLALPKTGWLSAAKALQLPLPDTSWMPNPWPRTRFTSWMD